MATDSITQLNFLSPYEREVATKIGLWKGRRKGLFSQVAAALRWPFERGVKAVISAENAAKWLLKLNQTAELKLGMELIQREAGVKSLTELRSATLELCDRLERHVEWEETALITSESCLAGVGGIVTELAAIPVEILLALTAIHRVSCCYGYPLQGVRDQTMVLGVMGLSMINDRQERIEWLEKLRALEHGLDDEAETKRIQRKIANEIREEIIEDIVESLESTIMQQLMGEAVPFVGSAIGVMLDNQFIYRVESTARHVFQERWLRDNGKIDEIPPIDNYPDVATGLSKVTYTTAYGIGFGITFPLALTAKAGATLLPRPAVDGFKDGAASAAKSARRSQSPTKAEQDLMPDAIMASPLASQAWAPY